MPIERCVFLYKWRRDTQSRSVKLLPLAFFQPGIYNGKLPNTNLDGVAKKALESHGSMEPPLSLLGMAEKFPWFLLSLLNRRNNWNEILI